MPHYLFLYLGIGFLVFGTLSKIWSVHAFWTFRGYALITWWISLFLGILCAASFFVQAGIMFAGGY